MLKTMLLIIGIALCGEAVAAETTGKDKRKDVIAEEAEELSSEAEHKVSSRLTAVYGEEAPLTKPKASKKHDRVTIVINETTTAKHEANTDLSRESDMDWALDKFFTVRFDKGGSLVAVPRLQSEGTAEASGNRKPEVKFTTERTHKAEGETERKTNFTAQVSGEVIEVLPNGHLSIEAKKSIKVNKETQEVIFTGRIDPKDLDSSNSVNSKFVIDMQIKFDGKGPLTRMQKRGWGSKVLDVVNPF